MRETFGSLQTQAQNYTNDTDTTTTLPFLKRELNRAQRFIFDDIRRFIGQRSQTASTVANQQYYHLPVDAVAIASVYITINSINYPILPIDSQLKWDELNALTIQATTIPTYFFERKADFGVWPIPQAVYTITLNYDWTPRDMSQSDYTTGTVSITNGSQTVTGSGTTFTKNMEGSWFQTTTDGYWYKITTFTDTTHVVLEQAFAGVTASAQAYTIGESPDIPGELHELLAFRAAEMYYSGLRKDHKTGAAWGNMFWTGDTNNARRDPKYVFGGLLGAKKRYASRSQSHIIRHNVTDDSAFINRIFAEKIS